jgi:hypothetical protein
MTPTRCHLCNDPPVAIFAFSRGCVCSPARHQPLCEHHARRATPLGTMELVEDLTADGEFGACWVGGVGGRGVLVGGAGEEVGNG